MKKIIFLLILSVRCYGQDCSVINTFTFHGVKFGVKFPDELRRLAKVGYFNATADSTFDIDNLKPGGQLYDWLYFNGWFSSIQFAAIKDGRLYSVFLYKNFDRYDSLAVKQGHMPEFYEAVNKELISVFGYSTEVTKKEDIVEKTVTTRWECDKQKIEFEAHYEGLTFFTLTFTDKFLERQGKILKYTQ